MTHALPRANLLYSPRNKILGTGLVIEAFLYEEQTGVASAGALRRDERIADHCTVCHKCQPPCPVNIDFGDVTIRMRKILTERARSVSMPAPGRPCSSSTRPTSHHQGAAQGHAGVSGASAWPMTWRRRPAAGRQGPYPAGHHRQNRGYRISRWNWCAGGLRRTARSAPIGANWGWRTAR